MKYPVVLILIAIALFFVAVMVAKSKQGAIRNILLSIVSVFFTLLALEIAFYFIPKTNNFGKTLGVEVWKRYYWNVNKDGFRDEDFSKKNKKKKKIVFIGDSFTVGYGISDPNDRFSNLVGSVVKDSFEFYNVGITGSNTGIKSEILSSLNFKPDLVIYQYFVDDIVDSRILFDGTKPVLNPYKNYPPAITFLIQNSYLINYIYWLFPHFILPDYKNYMEECYSYPALATEHEKIISKLIADTKAKNIRLVFLTIPFPSLYDYSNRLTKHIETLASDSGITVINVTAAVDTIPISEIIVNNNDIHFNERGHKIVANEILEKVFGIETTLPE
jgi:lysophospholipase L1-like esterase